MTAPTRPKRTPRSAEPAVPTEAEELKRMLRDPQASEESKRRMRPTVANSTACMLEALQLDQETRVALLSLLDDHYLCMRAGYAAKHAGKEGDETDDGLLAEAQAKMAEIDKRVASLLGGNHGIYQDHMKMQAEYAFIRGLPEDGSVPPLPLAQADLLARLMCEHSLGDMLCAAPPSGQDYGAEERRNSVRKVLEGAEALLDEAHYQAFRKKLQYTASFFQ